MKDLTKGCPAKVILLFAIPLILGNIFQQLYNMADSKIVSLYVGTGALAAVGATGVISNMITGFMNGLTQGFAILIARCFGAKDEKRMRQYVAGTILLTSVFGIGFTAISELTISGLLQVLQTPQDIFYEAESYIRIVLIGCIFSSIYNVCANMLRAIGDSKRPLYCLCVAIFLNIALDIVFVKGLSMGIQGAAYATVVSQGVAALLVGVYMLSKYGTILPRKKDWKLETGQYGQLLSSGLAMALMNCIVSIGTVVLQSSINGLGTKIVAAHTAGRRVFDILMIMIYTVGFAMTTYVSQNMGAMRVDRVKQGVRHAMAIVTVITTVVISVCFLVGDDMVRWLASTTDPEILKAAVMYIQVGVVFFYVLGPLFVLRCSLQGMGRKLIPVCSSILEMILKILSVQILVPRLQYFGVALTEPISWIAMTILLAGAYLHHPPKAIEEERRERDVSENVCKDY